MLVHIEVQGFYETTFAQRMYIYNYRIYDRYAQQVASLALLADTRPNWRPNAYGYELFGCKVRLEFPVVKLLDYRKREKDLKESVNPFAMVVLSYLKTRKTEKKPEKRFTWKVNLFKRLYTQGFSKEDILELMRFIDWIMVLPEELEQRFEEVVVQVEEEESMKYVTTFERIALKRGIAEGIQQGIEEGIEKGVRQGIKIGREEGRQEGREKGREKGRQEGWQEGREEGREEGIQEGGLEQAREDVLDILMIRFEIFPAHLADAVKSLEDLAILKELLKKAVTAGSLEEFQKELAAKEK